MSVLKAIRLAIIYTFGIVKSKSHKKVALSVALKSKSLKNGHKVSFKKKGSLLFPKTGSAVSSKQE